MSFGPAIDWYWYLLPMVPLLSRLVICLKFRHQMLVPLTAAEKDRETNRTNILALSGFSFTALLGVTIAGTTLHQNLDITVYFLLVSFICFFSTLNVQSYKHFKWIDQLSD